MAQTSWRSNTIQNRMENPNFVFPSSSTSPTTGGDGLPSSFQLQYGHFLRYWTGIGEGNPTQTTSSIHVKEITRPTTGTGMATPPIRRRVSFSTAVKVILIPSREEFRQAKIFDQVWYNRVTDFASFKRSACYELQHFMAHHQLLCDKEALRRLYQPCDVDNSMHQSDRVDPSSSPSSSSSIINNSSMEQKQDESTIVLVSTLLPTDDIDRALQQVCEAATAGARRTTSSSSSNSPPSPPPPCLHTSSMDSEGTPGTLADIYVADTSTYGSPRSIATKSIIPSPPTSPLTTISTKHKSCLKQSTISSSTSSSNMEKNKQNFPDDLTLGGLHPLALMTL